MEFLRKIEKNPYGDLYWNVPEVAPGGGRGTINVIGGSAGAFRTVVKTAEFLGRNYGLKRVGAVLPDALQGSVPEVPGVMFLKSTESGSFADAEELTGVFQGADFNLLVGDLSRNAETLKAVASASESSERPLLVTRDAVEAMLAGRLERSLMNPEIVWFLSLTQLIKVFRGVYYPRMLTLSQSLVQVAEGLHKFTLSYPCKIVTFVNGQILVSCNGEVAVVPVEKSGFSVMTMWNGELAARIGVLNLFNPGKFIEATVAGIFGQNVV